jgi:hypothetical protein
MVQQTRSGFAPMPEEKMLAQQSPAACTCYLVGRENACMGGLMRCTMRSSSFEIDGPSLCRTESTVDHLEETITLSKVVSRR